jgi:high-affinity iron transporter
VSAATLRTFGARVVLALALAWTGGAVAQADDASRRAQTLVHLLDYVAVDYPEFVRDGAVLDEAEYAEQREFAGEVARRLAELEAGDTTGPLETDAQALLAAIDARAPGADVATRALALRDAIVTTFEVAARPRRAPEPERVASLYAEACAMCHGAEGRGDGPAGAALDPAPSNFHDDARMDQRSVFGLYNTISLGVGGTGMPAFTQYDDDTRWALAFHVASLRHDEATRAEGARAYARAGGRPAIGDLGAFVATNVDAMERAGLEDAASIHAHLLTDPQVLELSHSSSLDEVRRLLRDAVERHAAGDADAAGELAVTAYLQGFEPVEALLDTRAPALRVEVESKMQALRQSLREGADAASVEAQVASIGDSLDRVGAALDAGQGNRVATALSAFLILFREGLEAILVVAAVLALVIRANRREVLRYVHLGWAGALVAGALTWWAARALVEISGATREITEGVAALLASAILLYVGFWLHAKSHAQAWNQFIARHMGGAMGARAVWMLAGVTFLAVYREAFETVLFYETLFAQEGPGGATALVAGALAAALALLVIGVAIFRYGMRLPLGPFFAASAILMAILAVVFAGQGIAALQEAGTIDADAIAFPRIEWLGIYPTLQTLAAQALALAIAVAVILRTRIARARVPR